MNKKRTFITGMGVISSLGNTTEELFNNLVENRSNIKCYEEWKKLNGLRSFLGAPAFDYDSKQIPRTLRRGMSRMSEMAYLATIMALEQAGISLNFENKTMDFSRTVINLGSTVGSPEANEEYHRKMFDNGGPAGQLATTFFKVMNHSVAANVAVALGYKGPLLSTSSACSTSLHAAILGAELVGAGLYDVAVVGGADELHYSGASTFDVVQAASINYNDRPDFASRPFDKDRDGLVISEGASILVIESEEHAKKRNAKIIAEVLGGAYFCDGSHLAHPNAETMTHTMQLALKKSGLSASKIDYVNAHATSTVVGDIEESKAIYELFKDKVPVSSFKGHLGHALAACGLIELIASITMMKKDLIIPTRNLENIDPLCAAICLPTKKSHCKVNTIVKNSFAFGGMNASLVVQNCL